MAVTTPRLVALSSPDHDRRTVPGSGLSIDEPLIPGGRTAAYDADRLELVHHFGDAHECRHWTERQPPEIDVGARENHAHAPVGEAVRQVDNAVVEELGLVHSDDFCAVAQAARDLFRRID